MDTPIANAAEARIIAETKRANSLNAILNQVNTEAKNGQTECLLFSNPPDMETVTKLVKLGFTISTVFHPFEQRTIYKIGW